MFTVNTPRKSVAIGDYATYAGPNVGSIHDCRNYEVAAIDTDRRMLCLKAPTECGPCMAWVPMADCGIDAEAVCHTAEQATHQQENPGAFCLQVMEYARRCVTEHDIEAEVEVTPKGKVTLRLVPHVDECRPWLGGSKVAVSADGDKA